MTCIHIIDDDKVSLELVKVLLEGLDFDIRCYGSALEFLENVTQETRGCVLTDMIMPGMSGIELQRELQALKIEIPIIIMSAHGDIRSARDAFKSGAPTRSEAGELCRCSMLSPRNPPLRSRRHCHCQLYCNAPSP